MSAIVRCIAIFMLLVLLPSVANAQSLEFAFSPSTGRGSAIAVDSTGAVYVAGSYDGSGDFDPGPEVFSLGLAEGLGDGFVAKYDVAGDFLWAFKLGGEERDEGVLAIAVDGSDDVYVTGAFEKVVDFDPGPEVFNLGSASNTNAAFLAKYDAANNLAWAFRLGAAGGSTTTVNALTTDSDNNVIVCGTISDTTDMDPGAGVFELETGEAPAYVAKYDAAGNFLWAFNIGEGGFNPPMEVLHDVAVDGEGRCLSIGTHGFSGGCASRSRDFRDLRE